MKKIVLAITGASGSIYSYNLLKKFSELNPDEFRIDLVMTSNAKTVWVHEMNNQSYEDFRFKRYEINDFNAPFASGSAGYQTMIICPCSMGTMSRIANGVSNDLISRAADVILKERQKLILVIRETPFNLIHINNMKTITEAGGIVCPASPSFYSKPHSLDELALTVVNRVMDLSGIATDSFRWGEGK